MKTVCIRAKLCFANIFFQIMLRFRRPALWIIDLSVCQSSIISIKLGVSNLLAFHHNAANFQLTKLINCHEGWNQWFALVCIKITASK